MSDLHFIRGVADSAEVLEHAYSEVMNAAERHQALFDIYAPDLSRLPGQAPVPLAEMLASADTLRVKNVCDDMDALLARWVTKELLRNSVVHALMWEYVQCMPESRREVRDCGVFPVLSVVVVQMYCLLARVSHLLSSSSLSCATGIHWPAA